jgi:hypothetical protein
MADDIKPRLRVPTSARKGEVIEIKTLVTHPMETGSAKDGDGKIVPRLIVNALAVTYNGKPCAQRQAGAGGVGQSVHRVLREGGRVRHAQVHLDRRQQAELDRREQDRGGVSLGRRALLQVAAATAALGASRTSGQSRVPTQADLLRFKATGQVTLLNFTDLHAQLVPIYFREPSANLGVAPIAACRRISSARRCWRPTSSAAAVPRPMPWRAPISRAWRGPTAGSAESTGWPP